MPPEFESETEIPVAAMEVVGSSALEAQERAHVDIQISTAHRYPRPAMSVVVRKMKELACLDEDTAEGCFYVLKRQGKEIRGPSVRLAEIAISQYGNMRAASRIIANDGKMITAQAMCHDLENNVAISIEVKRRITDKNGQTYSDDMQVVTGNAACAIALRNAVFKVIPLALIHPVYNAARACANGDQKTLSFRRERAMEAFIKMGATREQVLAAVDKPSIEDIDLEALETLQGMRTAIRDGDITVNEAFPPPVAKKPLFTKKREMEEKPPATTTASASEPEPDLAPDAPKAPEAPAGGTIPPEEIIVQLMAADKITNDELAQVLKSFSVRVPRNFTGPDCLTVPAQEETIKNWNEYRGVILNERGQTAP